VDRHIEEAAKYFNHAEHHILKLYWRWWNLCISFKFLLHWSLESNC